MSLASEILDKLPKSPVRMVPITCVTATPLTVTIFGTSDPVPARVMSGQVFAPGDTGMALWQPPMALICFKVT